MCIMNSLPRSLFFFFFNDTATTEIYTLSLHDALPILGDHSQPNVWQFAHASEIGFANVGYTWTGLLVADVGETEDRKSTRLNSSHDQISYAVFCLKKKKTT